MVVNQWKHVPNTSEITLSFISYLVIYSNNENINNLENIEKDLNKSHIKKLGRIEIFRIEKIYVKKTVMDQC